jgi:serine/threonine protein kinase
MSYDKILVYENYRRVPDKYMDIQELIGVTLGTCTLERIIGRGGMGAVYLAQQSRPVRTVAVKVLIPSISLDPDQQRVFLARFQREADTVAKLEHKNILPIYEYDEALVDHQRLAYLVMPFIRGGTLRERIDEANRDGVHFDLNLVASYISQVADALSYAHSTGVVHRDIKPGNLLFHLDGRLLLSDFGIVRLNAMPSLTSVGSFLGTAEYASPEQVSGGEVDARSDIYSLGVILYELLTGELPFTGPNPFAVMTRVLSDPAPSVRDVRPDLSPAIEAVVMKALAKNPAYRYQSATDMAAVLQAAVSAAFMPASALRISGDANNSDATVAESRVLAPSPARPVVHSGDTVPASPLPSADPVVPVSPLAPWQQQARPWQWPSRNQAQVQSPAVAPPGNIPPGQDSSYSPGAASVKTYRPGRRLFYYSAALAALLLQIPMLALLSARANGNQSPAVLGVLMGMSINLLALAALGLTAVTRSSSSRKFFNRSLAASLLAPLISGFFINFGADSRGLHVPILVYIVLLLSNIYTIRQLAKVDVPRDQVEVAPVHWRPAIVGALTGLLPLTIVLVFALVVPVFRSPDTPLLSGLFVSLFIALIGAPTPGAMMAVWLSKKMSFAELSRSSAVAGMLMFVGAFLLIALWSLLPSNNFLFFYKFDQPWIAYLLTAALLSLIGLLRGMLDAWVYQRVRRRN